MFKHFLDATMTSRNIMINCKRRVSYKRKNLPYHCFIKFNDYQELLMNNLNMKGNEARKVLWHQQNIFNVPEDRIVELCRLCQQWSIDMTTLWKNADLFEWTGNTLESRALLFREMGAIYMDAAMMSNFASIMEFSMDLFKAYTRIPQKTNVAKNLLKCLDPAPPNVPPMEALGEDLSVNEYHRRCLHWYAQWKLNIPKEDTEQMEEVVNCLKYRGFSFIKKQFDILHEDIGLTIDEIKKHGYLGSGSPDDLHKIINSTHILHNVDKKQLIKSQPILHGIDYNNVVQVEKLLDKEGFNKTMILKYPEVLLIPKYEVKARIEMLKCCPELFILRNSKYALRLISQFKKVQVRTSYLHYLNIKFVTVRAVTGETSNFERFVRTGLDRTRGNEIGYAFHKVLKLKPKEIERRVLKHPYWRQISLSLMHETLSFLLERFNPEDIHDNLQLILYPREKIEEILDGLPELNDPAQKAQRSPPYTPRIILAICLYEIERGHHFTGDGVWRDEASKKSLSSNISDAELSECSDVELSECSDSENVESEVIERASV